MEYDVIGDVHGHASALRALLTRLGYREHRGAWRHPERRALFMGDFIDRGPDQLAALRLVRGMVDAGSALAVMGNHEFNALGYHTGDPDRPGAYLRRHTEVRQREHAAFLAATADHPALRRELIDWFMTLPLWLDLQGLRAIHACWHPAALTRLAPALAAGQRLTPELLAAASREGSAEYDAIEIILKGPEVPLPDGATVVLGGKPRHKVRTRWWNRAARTYRESAILYGVSADLPHADVPTAARPGYTDRQPVFIGHYQLRGDPAPLASNVACVDYPGTHHGERLVAYRWGGEPALDSANFVTSD